MNEKPENTTKIEVPKPSKPSEQGGFYFSSFLKITDPDTKEILVQVRGDN